MLEHRPVDLLQHVEAHRDPEVGRDADDIGVERGVMQLAEREVVGKGGATPSRAWDRYPNLRGSDDESV
jgi:hypothetical protein